MVDNTFSVEWEIEQGVKSLKYNTWKRTSGQPNQIQKNGKHKNNKKNSMTGKIAIIYVKPRSKLTSTITWYAITILTPILAQF